MINGHTYGANFGYNSEGDTYGGTGLFQARRRISTEMSKRLRLLPNAHIPILITVTAGYWLKGAVVHSGSTYKFENMPAESAPVEVSGVFINGGETSLDEASSIANCVATAETFYFDSGNRVLYVNPPTSRNIFENTFQARLTLYFSRKSKNIRGVHWSGKLVSAPNLSLRIDHRFTGVGQIGGGSVSLANREGYFDNLDEIQWDAGTVTMEIGIDYPDGSADMDEADYQKVGTWRIEKVARSGGNFVLALREPKSSLENKIPRNEFNRIDYPNLADDMVGKPIPFAWGIHYGIKPIVVDRSARRFKLADHPIQSVDAVRKRNSDGSEGWQNISYTATTADLRAGEFTLASVDWQNNEELSVDFRGRTNADGTLMENPADVMQDLLDYCGERQLDSESFNISRAWYRTGVDRFGREVTFLAPCIYLDTQRTGIDVASEINSIAGSFLFVGHDGYWRYGAFQPVRASDLDPIAGTIIQTFTERDIFRDSMSKEVDSSKLFSKITVEFSQRKAEDWSERATVEVVRNGHLHNLAPQFTEVKKVGLGKATDARYWGQRFLTTEAEPMTKYIFAVAWTGFFLMPGDKVKVEHDRFGLNEVLEILECSYQFNSPPSVRITAGNNRAWKDTFSFVSPSNDGEANVPALGRVLWLRPNTIVGDPDSKITVWRDVSGPTNRNGAPGGSEGPLVRGTNHAIAPNNHSCVYMSFDSFGEAEAGHYFTFESLATQLNTTGAGEIFAVLRPDSITPTTGAPNAIWEFGGSPSTFVSDGGDIRESFGRASAVTGISAASVVAGWNLYNVSRTAGNLTVRVNNVSAYNADPGGAVAFTNGLLGSALAERWFNGAFAEVLVFNRVLTSAERTTVVQYLSNKYALGLVAAAASLNWNSAWTDAQVATARQNYGYVHNDNEMAHASDARSFWAGRAF